MHNYQNYLVLRKYGQLARQLRSADQNLLFQPRSNTVFASRAFRSAGPHLWNSLPNHLRTIDSYSSYKSHLKSHFFSTAFPSSPSRQWSSPAPLDSLSRFVCARNKCQLGLHYITFITYYYPTLLWVTINFYSTTKRQQNVIWKENYP